MLIKYYLEFVFVEILILYLTQKFLTHPLPTLFQRGNYLNIKDLSSPTLIRGGLGCVL